MGVWAFGVFESDDAADLGFEVDDAESPDDVKGVLTEAMNAVLSDPMHAERSDVLVAVAAAALVALSVGGDLSLEGIDEYGPQTWDPVSLGADPRLIASAREVVGLVCLPLAEQPWNGEEPLWDSAEDHAAYLREVSAIRDTLAAQR